MSSIQDYPYYPTVAERDAWIAGLLAEAESIRCEGEILNRRNFKPEMGCFNVRTCSYVRFCTDRGEEFYGYYDWVPNGPAPLIVHTPGYNSDAGVYHMMKLEGFNVLHVDPMGYVTPDGERTELRRDGTWPVLADTVSSAGEKGYRTFFLHTLLAIRWAFARPEVLPDRVSFFGTSQGGMASLVLGSLLAGRGARCVCADLPYLQGQFTGCYDFHPETCPDPEAARRAMALLDGLAHADRLSGLPVLLTSATADGLCPEQTIRPLFDALSGHKAYMSIKDQVHCYTQEFLYLTAAWMRMYA